MAETKKRPLADDQEMGVAKKRAVASVTDSPIPVNGKVEVGREELNATNLEKFRKEAIYRRMKHYSRENERAQDQIAELEKRRDILEANVAAIDACWKQLIHEVRLLVKPETLLTPEDLDQDMDLFNIASDPRFSETDSPLSESLLDHGRATQKLLAAFVSLAPQIPSPDNDDLRVHCSNLQKEVTKLHAEVSLANSRIAQVEDEKDLYHSRLLAAEARADRANSATTQAIRTRSGASEKEGDTTFVKEEVKEEEGIVDMANLSSQQNPGEDQILTKRHNTPSREDQDWKALYETCDRKNQELVEEVVQLKARCNELALELASPSVDTLQQLPLYKSLTDRLQFFVNEVEHYKQKWTELTPQINELREQREDFKEKLIADYNVRYDEQKSLLIKRDHENLRLREQRDALQAEINEVKSRGTEKKSTAQLQILLQSRADRIAALELESKRLKSQLAANAGEEHLLELILGDKLQDLPERLRAAERKVEALEASVATLDANHPDIAQHIRSETEARESLTVALNRLERFESIFGSGSSVPPEQKAMAEKLKENEERLRVANLQHQQEQVASNDLFSEIERLSTAWEALDRQNKAKVFDMDTMEAKLQKLAGEKAKADNKYFGAMRQKEAAEAERKASIRAVEKLQKAIERFTEAEKGYTSKLTIQEKEISQQKARCDHYAGLMPAFERDLKEQQWRHEQDKKLVAEVKRQIAEAHAQEKQHRADARRFEEESVRARKEAERLAVKVNAISPGVVTSRELELEQKYDTCMQLLRCSTCKQALRSHVLTKCMHSFCKDCIQARIDTRQRKCPYCSMGFSQSEFQQLYFQG